LCFCAGFARVELDHRREPFFFLPPNLAAFASSTHPPGPIPPSLRGGLFSRFDPDSGWGRRRQTPATATKRAPPAKRRIFFSSETHKTRFPFGLASESWATLRLIEFFPFFSSFSFFPWATYVHPMATTPEARNDSKRSFLKKAVGTIWNGPMPAFFRPTKPINNF